MTIPEYIWRKAELNQLRRERIKRINNGTITPVFAMKPQLMVMVNGKWSPAIVGANQ